MSVAQVPLWSKTSSPSVVCQTFPKLLEYGFNRFYAVYSFFTFKKGEKFMALLVYVDDFVLPRNDSNLCTDFKAYLDKCFHIKDLGALEHFLGIEVTKIPRDYFCVKENMSWTS